MYLCCEDVIDHRTASDLVADVRKQSAPQQPSPPQSARAAPPIARPRPALTDDSPAHQDVADDNDIADVERGDNDDNNFQQRRPPADLRTPPPPPPHPPHPPPVRTTPAEHRARPITAETSVTSVTPRRDLRLLPGGSSGSSSSSSGTQWWNGGLRSSSESRRSTSAVVVVTLTVVSILRSS